jgi:hypothetical protein
LRDWWAELTTSGTYDFNPSLADFVLNAYALVGVGRTDLKQMHLQDARLQANFLLTEWSNRQVNLWTVDLQEFPLAEGVATYELPITTIAVLDAYVRTGDDTSGFIDRIIFPVSRTDYAALPNKGVPAQPTQFWFDRSPQHYAVAGARCGRYLHARCRCRQIQDAVPQAGDDGTALSLARCFQLWAGRTQRCSPPTRRMASTSELSGRGGTPQLKIPSM